MNNNEKDPFDTMLSDYLTASNLLPKTEKGTTKYKKLQGILTFLEKEIDKAIYQAIANLELPDCGE